MLNRLGLKIRLMIPTPHVMGIKIGFTDKKKKYHEVVSEKDISGMTIRVNYETCEDIKVELDDELIKESN